jgi:Mrp family chromosome partitioning ATPase
MSGGEKPNSTSTASSEDEQQRSIDVILTRFGKLPAGAAAKIRKRMERSGEPFAISASRLQLVPAVDLEIAGRIAEGSLHECAAAFALHPSLVTLREPRAAAAQEYKALRTRLLTTQTPDKLNLVSVVPAGAAAKAAAAAGNLAAAFAEFGRRVLLVDAALERPMLAKLFSAGRGEGLAALLAGALPFADAVQPTPVRGLDLLGGRAPSGRPQTLLAGPAFAETLARARETYDIVLVLTASGADGQLVWAKTPSALAVAERGKTRSEELKSLQSILRQVGTEILGAVIAG